ncbi:YNL305C-like protein [Anopheles sinensis]|uniref:YNL305C-like protein n=1 Tax=Anopheles sinensis TaxID=74873 RepID=A0A084WDL9_ANOSI|nr:YNL305C-like protein [Anopheles sinensis]
MSDMQTRRQQQGEKVVKTRIISPKHPVVGGHNNMVAMTHFQRGWKPVYRLDQKPTMLSMMTISKPYLLMYDHDLDGLISIIIIIIDVDDRRPSQRTEVKGNGCSCIECSFAPDAGEKGGREG